MVFNLNFEKVRAFSKECTVALRAEFVGMRSFLLSLVFLVSIASQASGGREYTIENQRIISCDGGIAGAVLRSDVDRSLTSVVILMDDAPSPLGGFSVALYTEAEEKGRPGKRVAKLNGPDNPSVAGRYVYETSDEIVLEASKSYWVVASVQRKDSAFCFQVVKADSQIATNVNSSSFVRLGEVEQPLVDAPAIFAEFGGETAAFASTGAERFKTLWTLLLSGVILVCCVDLIPFGRFGSVR